MTISEHRRRPPAASRTWLSLAIGLPSVLVAAAIVSLRTPHTEGRAPGQEALAAQATSAEVAVAASVAAIANAAPQASTSASVPPEAIAPTSDRTAAIDAVRRAGGRPRTVPHGSPAPHGPTPVTTAPPQPQEPLTFPPTTAPAGAAREDPPPLRRPDGKPKVQLERENPWP